MRILARLGVTVLVIAAASAIWWLDALRERQPAPTAKPKERHEPDYYFEDFALRAHQTEGEPRYVLHGERLVHFADDDTSEVTEPRLRYDRPEDDPWHVSGRRGVVNPRGDVVDLYEDVVMENRGGQQPMRLHTSRMTVYTEAGRAQTDRPVTMTSPGSRVDAVGMTAWFESDLVELHEDVRGRHDPRSTN